jgi:hypothetical protein
MHETIRSLVVRCKLVEGLWSPPRVFRLAQGVEGGYRRGVAIMKGVIKPQALILVASVSRLGVFLR